MVRGPDPPRRSFLPKGSERTEDLEQSEPVFIPGSEALLKAGKTAWACATGCGMKPWVRLCNRRDGQQGSCSCALWIVGLGLHRRMRTKLADRKAPRASTRRSACAKGGVSPPSRRLDKRWAPATSGHGPSLSKEVRRLGQGGRLANVSNQGHRRVYKELLSGQLRETVIWTTSGSISRYCQIKVR